MICIPTQPASAPAWHAGFLAFLPAVVRQASRAFRHLKPEARHDAVEEVVAYARLVECAFDRWRVFMAIPCLTTSPTGQPFACSPTVCDGVTNLDGSP